MGVGGGQERGVEPAMQRTQSSSARLEMKRLLMKDSLYIVSIAVCRTCLCFIKNIDIKTIKKNNNTLPAVSPLSSQSCLWSPSGRSVSPPVPLITKLTSMHVCVFFFFILYLFSATANLTVNFVDRCN